MEFLKALRKPQRAKVGVFRDLLHERQECQFLGQFLAEN
jgi:hypothetical protein